MPRAQRVPWLQEGVELQEGVGVEVVREEERLLPWLQEGVEVLHVRVTGTGGRLPLVPFHCS